jgi:hypothetical protein
VITLVATVIGLVIWLVLWAFNVKAIDAFLITIVLALGAQTFRMMQPFIARHLKP